MSVYIRLQDFKLRFGSNVLGIDIMEDSAKKRLLIDDAATGAVSRDYLLAEVDFKWLMAGEGRWIDTTRFHGDPVYAGGLIRWALASSSFALRECAALLQTQMHCAHPGNVAGQSSNALRLRSAVKHTQHKSAPS